MTRVVLALESLLFMSTVSPKLAVRCVAGRVLVCVSVTGFTFSDTKKEKEKTTPFGAWVKGGAARMKTVRAPAAIL